MGGGKMFWPNTLYLLGLAGPPICLSFAWYGWLRSPRLQSPKWRMILFFSSLCAGTINFVLLWSCVVWLKFHYNAESWRVRDFVSDVGIYLLLYSIVAAIAGKGRHRILLGVGSVLAILPWIPFGIL